MTITSEFSPQTPADPSDSQEPTMTTDGEMLVAMWRRWEFHDQEVFSGETGTKLGDRDLIFDRLFDIMHQKHDLFPMLESSFPRTVIPDLFWTGRAFAKVAPGVEFFLDLADALMSSTATEQGG